MSVYFSRFFEAELESIGDYIAKENPHYSVLFVSKVREFCKSVAKFPMKYAVYKVIDGVEIRRAVYKNYVIFYQVNRNDILILHVLHGARDYTSTIEELN